MPRTRQSVSGVIAGKRLLMSISLAVHPCSSQWAGPLGGLMEVTVLLQELARRLPDLEERFRPAFLLVNFAAAFALIIICR
jgi:hypothetical protein